jgi:hypothetical protein
MLVVNAARNVATGRVLLGTYLGTDAAERMLSGNVVRGEAEPIRAAIWFSDLADFMRISDGAPAPEWQALSNISPQGQRIIELGFCEGNLSPASHSAYFLAVQSR